MMPGQDFLSRLAQIVEDVPAIGNLKRLRSSTRCPTGRGGAAVPTDERHRRVSLQPSGKRLSSCVSQQIDGDALFQIYQQRPIALTFAPGPLIDPSYFDWGRWR
jgi:hypothetical protein